jgi:hypothetical protein
LQHPVHLRKRLLEIIAPLQRQVGPYQACAGIFHRHLFHIASHVICLILSGQEFLPPQNRRTGLQMHWDGNVHCEHLGGRVAHNQLTGTVAGAAAGV